MELLGGRPRCFEIDDAELLGGRPRCFEIDAEWLGGRPRCFELLGGRPRFFEIDTELFLLHVYALQELCMCVCVRLQEICMCVRFAGTRLYVRFAGTWSYECAKFLVCPFQAPQQVSRCTLVDCVVGTLSRPWTLYCKWVMR